MKEDVRKKIIQTRFRKSVNTYNNEAVIQKMVSENLAKLIFKYSHTNLNILEIGCGTGFLSQILTNQLKGLETYYLNDIVATYFDDEFLARLDQPNIKIKTIIGDAENLRFPTNLDLITSASTIQWFKNPSSFFKNAYSSLNSEGLLIFSSFTKDNFLEINNVLGVGLEYPSLDEIVHSVENSGFKVLIKFEERKTLNFDHASEVLSHIKKTGVNGVISSEFWTKTKLQKFYNDYENKYATEKGVPLSYNPYYIVAKKIQS